MKKQRLKRLFCWSVIAAALVTSVFLGWRQLAGSVHRINPYTAIKVRLGMTQRDVEAIFGVPPGDYSSEPSTDQTQTAENRRPDLHREEWTADEGGTVVYFGSDGRVAGFTLWVAPGRDMSKLEGLRKWWYWLTVW